MVPVESMLLLMYFISKNNNLTYILPADFSDENSIVDLLSDFFTIVYSHDIINVFDMRGISSGFHNCSHNDTVSVVGLFY